MFIIDYRILTL